MDGSVSNPVLVPALPASTGIYTVDGSGLGPGYILSSDGSLNSPSESGRAELGDHDFRERGSVQSSRSVCHDGAVTAVYIVGFYADGIATQHGPAVGFPGNVF
jgi:hypothetical protein